MISMNHRGFIIVSYSRGKGASSKATWDKDYIAIFYNVEIGDRLRWVLAPLHFVCLNYEQPDFADNGENSQSCDVPSPFPLHCLT